MHNKPTGKTGFTRMSNKGVTFHKLLYPKEKPEIELFIANYFVNQLNSNNTKVIKDFIQNDEDNYDFTLILQSGVQKYLELMEIFPQNGGYNNATGYYKDLEMAEYIVERIISGKSIKYESKSLPIDLLIYPTGYQFVLSELCKQLIGFLLNSKKIIFNGVFYFSLFDQNTGDACLLYPNNYSQIDVEKYKNSTTYNLDPENGKKD